MSSCLKKKVLSYVLPNTVDVFFGGKMMFTVSKQVFFTHSLHCFFCKARFYCSFLGAIFLVDFFPPGFSGVGETLGNSMGISLDSPG